MRKNFNRIISGILTVTILCFGVNFNVLAAESEVVVIDDTEGESEEKSLVSETVNSDNENLIADDFNEGINEDEFQTNTFDEENSDKTSEENEEVITYEDNLEIEDIITEEFCDIEDKAFIDEERDSKKSKKELSRAELYEKNRKNEGVTLDKSADEIMNPYKYSFFDGDNFTDLVVWDSIYFGAYYQTDTDKDGKFDDEKKEPIKWRVLTVDDNHKAILYSESVLDHYEYTNPSGMDEIYWKNSKIRSWLNGYSEEYNRDEKDFSKGNAFIDAAFNESERAALLEREQKNNVRYYESDEYLSQYDTADKVFLISLAETESEDYGFYEFCGGTKSEMTDYAKRPEYGEDGSKLDLKDAYYLRDVQIYPEDDKEDSIPSYLADMRFCESGLQTRNDYNSIYGGVIYELGGVRPAIFVDLDEVEWAYAGQVSSSGIPYLEVYAYYDSNGGEIEYEKKLYSIFSRKYEFPEVVNGEREFDCWEYSYPKMQGSKEPKEQGTFSYVSDMEKDWFVACDGVYFFANWKNSDVVLRAYLNLIGYEDYYAYPYSVSINSAVLSSNNNFRHFFELDESVMDQLEPYFLGFYTEPVGGERLTRWYTIQESTNIYAHWDTSEVDERDEDNFKLGEFWTSSVNPIDYTGKKVKPEVRVYYGFKRLIEGKDYAIKYLNNVYPQNGDSDAAPTIVITGKGNYSSEETVTFTINSADLSEQAEVENMWVKYSGNVMSPVPEIKINGQKIVYKKDFVIKYYKYTEGEISYDEEVEVKEPGKYRVRIIGQGYYCGEIEVELTVSSGKDVKDLKVSKIKDVYYDFTEGFAACPLPEIKDGNYVLKKNVDYICEYIDNCEPGIATVLIKGTDNPENERSYYGCRKITFKILADSIKGASLTGIEKEYVYTGTDITSENICVVKDEKTLVEGKDYVVTYLKNINVGKATVEVKGCGGYTGVIKKTFNIKSYNIKNNLILDGEKEGIICNVQDKVVYACGGAKSEVSLFYKNSVGEGYTLAQGKDYKLKYSNINKINDGTGKKKPTVKISGKGNYSGTITVTYIIDSQSISECSALVSDAMYSTKAGKWKSAVVVKDVNGKKLKSSKDYDKNVKYVYDNITQVTNCKNRVLRYPGEEISKKDILDAGTIIRVEIVAKGNYIETLKAKYKISPRNFSDVNIQVKSKEYTGRFIELKEDDITVTYKGSNLIFNEKNQKNIDGISFYIVGYSNNIDVGTAEVTVRGGANYKGTKTVKFKITPKKIKWWWNKEGDLL